MARWYLGIGLGVLLCFSVSFRQTMEFSIPEIPYSMLHNGDLAFRRGNGFVSNAILAAERNGLYSHVGIIFFVDSAWRVIHAVPGEWDFPGDIERVKADPLESFFAPSRASHGE